MLTNAKNMISSEATGKNMNTPGEQVHEVMEGEHIHTKVIHRIFLVVRASPTSLNHFLAEVHAVVQEDGRKTSILKHLLTISREKFLFHFMKPITEPSA